MILPDCINALLNVYETEGSVSTERLFNQAELQGHRITYLP